jgi:hypothetical protein
MRKAFSGIALAILGFAFIVLTAGSSTATVADVPNVHIGDVGYNARGNDTVWNRNKEYVDITIDANATSVDLDGFVITDRWGFEHSAETCNRYTVQNVTLTQTVKTLRVYVGLGAPVNGATHFTRFMNSKCGYHGHIFNNLGDTVYLKNGSDYDSKSYDFENGYYVN